MQHEHRRRLRVGEGPRLQAIVTDDGAGDRHQSDRARMRVIRQIRRGTEDGRGGQEARMSRELHGECEELRPLACGVRPATSHEEASQ